MGNCVNIKIEITTQFLDTNLTTLIFRLNDYSKLG